MTEELIIVEKEIEGKIYKIQELSTDSALDTVDDKNLSRKEMLKKLVVASVIDPKITAESFGKLPSRIGTKIIDEVNKINGFVKDFPEVQPNLPKKENGS